MWDARKLADFVAQRLGGQRFLMVTNREPYVHRRKKDALVCEKPAGGVTSALDPVMQVLGGTWIAWGSGDADREAVDAHSRIRVPQETPRYTLRRIWLSKEEVDGFYNGYANRCLWPLCHTLVEGLQFRRRYWEAYKIVNARYARAILEEAGDASAVVWMHDYHLSLVPRMVREATSVPLTLTFFWHIPWPAYDIFRICPQRREILEGLLANDLLGFQLPGYAHHFLECLQEELGAEASIEEDRVFYRDHTTRVRHYPISIDFEAFERWATSPRADRRILALLQDLRIQPGQRIGIGVDRLDYTKGILHRLQALDLFFARYPQYHQRFTFIQVAVPSRGLVPRYRELRRRVEAKVQEINARYGKEGWQPIVYIPRNLSQEVLAAYYRTAHLAIVSSLYDGMNLVAKEFIASQVEGKGMLLLSEFAGAYEEIKGVIHINPYDTENFAEAIREALEMDPGEKLVRLGEMRAYLREHNIYAWMADIFRDMAALARGSASHA